MNGHEKDLQYEGRPVGALRDPGMGGLAEIIQGPGDVGGFAVLHRRLAVERAFARMSRRRRLASSLALARLVARRFMTRGALP